MDDCGEEAQIHLKIIDSVDDWYGMEGDLCEAHGLKKLMKQWEESVRAITE
jgi:hypothetical protein